MKNYADRGGCYPPKPKAEADNTLLDLHNSSYHTQPHPIIANYTCNLQYTPSGISTNCMPLKVSGGKLSHPNAVGIMFLLLLHQSSQEQKIFLWSLTVIFITKPIKIIINHWQSLSKGDDIHVFEPWVSSAQKLNFFEVTQL